MESIDHIFFINLDRRRDRFDHFMAEYTRMQLPVDKLERFPAIYVPQMTCLGCTLSHLEVCKLAKQRGYTNVLIFEDDFEFLVTPDVLEARLRHFFSQPRDYMVLMLAYNIPNGQITRLDDVLSVADDIQTASGYLVNGRYLDRLIQCLTDAKEQLAQTGAHWLYMNDQYWKTLQTTRQWYIFNDRIGKQYESYSDLAHRVVDYQV